MRKNTCLLGAPNLARFTARVRQLTARNYSFVTVFCVQEGGRAGKEVQNGIWNLPIPIIILLASVLALSANWRCNDCTLLSTGGHLAAHDQIKVPVRASGVKYLDRATRWYSRQKAAPDDGCHNRRP